MRIIHRAVRDFCKNSWKLMNLLLGRRSRYRPLFKETHLYRFPYVISPSMEKNPEVTCISGMYPYTVNPRQSKINACAIIANSVHMYVCMSPLWCVLDLIVSLLSAWNGITWTFLYYRLIAPCVCMCVWILWTINRWPDNPCW